MHRYLSLFEKSLFILTILLLVAVPLYPKFPFLNVGGTFVAIRLEDFLIAFTLLVWGIYLILSNKIWSFFKDRLNKTIVLFFFIGALSTFSAIFLTETATFNLGLLHYLRRVELMLLLPLMLTVIKTRRQLIIILAVLGVVLALVNGYALGQQYLGWPVVSTTNSEFSKGQIVELTAGGRVNSTFAGHYDLAVYLMMALSFIAAFLFTSRNILIQGSLLLLSAVSSAVLILTAARFSFVAAVAGVGFAFLLGGKKLLIFLMLILVAVILIYPSQLRDRLISTITVNLWDQGERHMEVIDEKMERARFNIPTLPTRYSSETAKESTESANMEKASDIAEGEPIDTTELGVYRSFRIRLDVEWPRALRALNKNPILGTGYSSLGLATDNDYLRMLGEVGILGTAAFGLIIIEIIKRIWSGIKQSDKLIRFLSVGTLAMVFGFLSNGVFIDVFEASKVATLFWMVAGLNLASLKMK